MRSMAVTRVSQTRRLVDTPLYAFLNRVLGAMLFILVMPVICLVGALLWLECPGPILFRQVRLGQNRRQFQIIKLRSMRMGADDILRRRLETDALAAREWRLFGRLTNDPRIGGPIARFVRRHSLDELPQLWNVACADMRLVGPRPLPPSQSASLPEELVAYRTKVPPGVTGLWQVRGRSETTLLNMARYDALYIRRRSVRLDCYCLLRTFRAVVSARGAF